MVHRTFKGSVSKMNWKNIEFDLIRQHNTLQTIRYLIDGGEDDRFSNVGQGFQIFTTDPLLQPILSDWYMTQGTQEEDIIDIGMYNFFFKNKVNVKKCNHIFHDLVEIFQWSVNYLIEIRAVTITMIRFYLHLIG